MLKKPKITDERWAWMNPRKHFDQYGKLAVGQRVKLERFIYAPTNNPGKLRRSMRNEQGKIVMVDPSCTIYTQHTITDIRESETGAFVFLLDELGCVHVEVSNGYGQTDAGFISVLRDAPQQREIAA